MPVFRYQAVDNRGRSLGGVMPAHDEPNLEQKLRNLGLWLTEAVAEKVAPPKKKANKLELFLLRARSKRHRRELIEFCTLMSYQVKVGIPLVRAIEVACQDCKDPGFSKILSSLQRELESGFRLHEALAHYPGVFSAHFVSVLRAGETSSKLPEAFEDMRNYLEWVDKVVAEVRQATLYPAIVLTVITTFVLFLFTFIIPKFAELLDKLQVKQPFLTQIVFMVGDAAKATWWIWLPCLLAVIIGIPIARRTSTRVALQVDNLKLRLPIFGELNQMLALSRFAHNLAILYRSGLPLLQALELCKWGLIGNAVVEQAVAEVEEDVKTGSTISEAMHRQSVFTAMLLRMVAMGESTGKLDEALENVTEYYNNVIPRRIKAVFAVLEPALMLLLIGIVGVVALSIYLPILSLMSTIRR
jgi:type II secretory pathway component PulF